METQAVDKNIFQTVIGFVWGAIAFVIAWVTRNTLRANKTNELIAAITERNHAQDQVINEVRRDVKEMKLALLDWKETNNNTLIRVNKVLKELGE